MSYKQQRMRTVHISEELSCSANKLSCACSRIMRNCTAMQTNSHVHRSRIMRNCPAVQRQTLMCTVHVWWGTVLQNNIQWGAVLQRDTNSHVHVHVSWGTVLQCNTNSHVHVHVSWGTILQCNTNYHVHIHVWWGTALQCKQTLMCMFTYHEELSCSANTNSHVHVHVSWGTVLQRNTNHHVHRSRVMRNCPAKQHTDIQWGIVLQCKNKLSCALFACVGHDCSVTPSVTEVPMFACQIHTHTHTICTYHMGGQNRINTPYMTVYLVNSLPKIPYIHRIYIWFWPTLHVSYGWPALYRNVSPDLHWAQKIWTLPWWCTRPFFIVRGIFTNLN